MAKPKNTTNWTDTGEPETAEEVEIMRQQKEARKKKNRENPDNPTPVVEPPVVDSPDNDITSIRTATPEDPTGSQEIIVDNNTPEQPVEPSENSPAN